MHTYTKITGIKTSTVIKMACITVLLSVLALFIAPQKAFAIFENTNNVPTFIQDFDKNCGGYKHYQNAWLSQAGNNSITTVNVPQGNDSVDLWLNFISAQCNTNIDANGNIIDKDLKITRVRTTSASSSAGYISSGLVGSYVDMDYQWSYQFNVRYIKDQFDMTAHNQFTLSGLSSLPVGNHTITVSAEARFIHKYIRQNGQTQYICVQPAPGQPNPQFANGLDDPACGLAGPQFPINIRIVSTDKPPTGQVRGDCSAFNGGNASLVGWAIDPDRPVVNGTTPTPVRVLVYKDQPFSFDPNNQPIYNGIANLQTDGETQNLFGINGNYGFKIPISDYNDASPHNFYVYVVGVDANGIENGIYRQIYADPLAANAPGSGNPPSAVVGPCAPPNCSAMQPYVAGTNFPVEQPEVGQAFDLVLGTGYNPGVSANQTLTITANLTQSTAISGVPQTVTATIPPPTNLKATNLRANAAGTYTMVWTLNWNGGTRTCQGELQVVRKPYVKAYGNDVHAGGVVTQSNSGINDTSSCSINDVAAAGGNTKASVFALSREEGYAQPPPNNFYGASSQFAVSALGEVADFFSAGMHSPRRASFAASPVTGLTFGNYNYPTEYTTNDWDPTNPNQTLDTRKVPDYGGNSGIVRCVPDYFAAAPANSQARSGYNIATLAGDGAIQIVANGDYGRVNIAGTELSGKKAVYVDGDVVINENITFSGINGEANVPSLYLIVKGNIYIRNEVSRLDGVYIAQQDENGEGGAIYTCTRSASQQNILFNKNQLVDVCNRQLVINGAFLADTIKFLRTNGTVQASGLNEPASSPSIAEVFNFSPETYIGGANSTLRRGAGSYDYITSLAPIL